jgi:hypothetical protein
MYPGSPLAIAISAIWRQYFQSGAKKTHLAKVLKNPTFRKKLN